MAKVKKQAVEPEVNSFRADFKKRLSRVESPVVKVAWLDAKLNYGSQLSIEEGWEKGYQSGMLMEDVGFLLKHDRNWITIAMDRDAQSNGIYRQTLDIPRDAVCRVKVLSNGTMKRKEFTAGLEDILE